MALLFNALNQHSFQKDQPLLLWQSELIGERISNCLIDDPPLKQNEIYRDNCLAEVQVENQKTEEKLQLMVADRKVTNFNELAFTVTYHCRDVECGFFVTAGYLSGTCDLRLKKGLEVITVRPRTVKVNLTINSDGILWIEQPFEFLLNLKRQAYFLERNIISFLGETTFNEIRDGQGRLVSRKVFSKERPKVKSGLTCYLDHQNQNYVVEGHYRNNRLFTEEDRIRFNRAISLVLTKRLPKDLANYIVNFQPKF